MPAFIDLTTDLHPVRNPVRVGLTGDDMVTTQGYVPSWTITCESAPPPGGQTIQLTFGSTIITFTQAVSPDASAGEWNGGTRTDMRNSLLAAMLANYFLSTHYVISPSGLYGILLQGYEVGTTYGLTDNDISDNSPTVWGITGAGTGGTTGIDQVVRANYALLMQLWVEDVFGSDVYDLKLEERIPANADGEASTDISTALRAYVDPPYFPSNNLLTAELMTGSFKRFKLRYAEIYGTREDVVGVETSDVNFAYLAGRSEPARVEDAAWEDQLETGGKLDFLTNWPNTEVAKAKRVTTEQREFLCQLVVDTHTLLTLRADLFYTDYTVAEGVSVDTYGSGVDVRRGDLVIWPVGASVQQLEDYMAGKILSHYSLWVENDANQRITEKRWYKVDRENRDNYRQFHYINTAGGIDTLAIHGPRTEEVIADLSRATRNVPYEPTDTMGARDHADMLNAMDLEYEVGTEHLNQDELQALRDLLASELVAERVLGDHWPVQVLNKKMDMADERDARTPKTLKYRYAMRTTANTLLL